MPDEQTSHRKPGPKPKGEAAMSGAERTRLYRERMRAQQAESQPTQAELDRAERVVAVVEEVLGRIYERLGFVELGIQRGSMDAVRSAHWDIKHLAYEIAIAVGAKYSIHPLLRSSGNKVWFDPKTKLPKSGGEFPAGAEANGFIHAVL